MFENLQMIFILVKSNLIEKRLAYLIDKRDKLRAEMLASAKDLLNTDISKMPKDWLKEKYEESNSVLEMVMKSSSDMTFAELIAKYYDFVQKLEDEIRNRNLNIELGLVEKYKKYIYK